MAARFHPRWFTPVGTFALWIDFAAIISGCAAATYMIYAALVLYRQFHSASTPVPPTVGYLCFGGLLFLVFSGWRLSHAIRRYNQFRAEYKAHREATK